MATEADRRIFELIPPGPDLPPDALRRLAGSAGELVGALVDGAVRTWLLQRGAKLVLVVWPRAFRARLDPLELLDEHGEVIAAGGQHVSVVGGYLPSGDPLAMGHEHAFAAWSVSSGIHGP